MHLSNGEFIVNAQAAQRNASLLNAINSGGTAAPTRSTVIQAYGYGADQVAGLMYQKQSVHELLYG